MRICGAAIAGVCAVLFAASAVAQDYLLSPQDRVSLRVVEWQPAQATYKEWEALTGEYVVGEGGTIAIPLVGAVEAGGRSPQEVATEIGDRLQQQLGLATRPDSTIEIVAYAPVFVLGDVAQPGRIDFQPRLTALQAVSAAGGYYRGNDMQRGNWDAISAEGNLRLAELTAGRAAARLSRLRAEFEGEEEIEVPPEFTALTLATPDQLIEEERRIMEIREQALESRLSSADSLKTLLLSRLDTLAQQSANLDRQIQLVQEELDSVTTLLDRGLATTQRANGLERTLAEYEGRRLELESTTLDVSRQLNETEREAIDLRTDFRAEVASEMQAARSALDRALTEVSINQSLFVEASTRGARLLGADEDGPQVVFLLSGRDGGPPREISPETELSSGDVLEIRVTPDASVVSPLMQ